MNKKLSFVIVLLCMPMSTLAMYSGKPTSSDDEKEKRWQKSAKKPHTWNTARGESSEEELNKLDAMPSFKSVSGVTLQNDVANIRADFFDSTNPDKQSGSEEEVQHNRFEKSRGSDEERRKIAKGCGKKVVVTPEYIERKREQSQKGGYSNLDSEDYRIGQVKTIWDPKGTKSESEDESYESSKEDPLKNVRYSEKTSTSYTPFSQIENASSVTYHSSGTTYQSSRTTLYAGRCFFAIAAILGGYGLYEWVKEQRSKKHRKPAGAK